MNWWRVYLGRRCKCLAMSLKMTTQRTAFPKSGDRVPPPDLHMTELMVVLKGPWSPLRKSRQWEKGLTTYWGRKEKAALVQLYIPRVLCGAEDAHWLGLYWVLPNRAIWSGLLCFAERKEVDPLVVQGLIKESSQFSLAHIKASAWEKRLAEMLSAWPVGLGGEYEATEPSKFWPFALLLSMHPTSLQPWWAPNYNSSGECEESRVQGPHSLFLLEYSNLRLTQARGEESRVFITLKKKRTF